MMTYHEYLELALKIAAIALCVYLYRNAENISNWIVNRYASKMQQERTNFILCDLDRIGRNICRDGLWEEMKYEWFDALQESVHRSDSAGQGKPQT